MIMSGRGGGGGVGVANGGGCRFPFTASQWQELEHQALIFKYMVSGVPIPPDLLFNVRRSIFLDSSTSTSNLLFPHSSSTSPHIGWSCFQMGLGMRKIDPEPGRCRRTDGKKWRCSKEAFQDSKYCEKHMHRGKNRSRKPVEPQQQLQQVLTASTTTTTPSSMVKPTTQSYSISSSVTSDNHHHQHQNHNHFYPPSYCSNTHPYHHSKVVDSATELGLYSGAHHRMVGGLNGDSWQQSALKMSGSSGGRISTKHQHQHQQEYPPYFQFQGFEDYESIRTCDDDDDNGRRTGTEKTVYRFLEECPPDTNNKDSSSWLNLDDNKSSNCSPLSTTQLSISIPTAPSSTSSHHPQHQLFPVFNSRQHQNADNSHF